MRVELIAGGVGRMNCVESVWRMLLVIGVTVSVGHSQEPSPISAGQSRAKAAKSPFEQWDKNSDGFLDSSEFPSRFSQALFERIDKDNDGKLSRLEDDRYRAANRKRAPEVGGSVGSSDRRRNDSSTKKPTGLPEGTKVDRDLTYATVGERKLPLDLYRPPSAAATPLVIWVHGGGWKGGTKTGAGPALALLDRGYAVASVEYRLSGEAIFPAAIEDCKAAVSFLRLHAKEYNLDPNRFGVWGSSAGGHLVSLLGTSHDVDDFDTHAVCRQASSNVQAVCNWFGPSDFLRMNDFPGKIDHDAAGSPESLFIGAPIQQQHAKSQRANPITYVSPGDPPFLHLHGEADQAVP
ncbi:MAG: alpha/beta hydrolase fold domain-containing protein, partial [Rubripirellula sp.]